MGKCFTAGPCSNDAKKVRPPMQKAGGLTTKYGELILLLSIHVSLPAVRGCDKQVFLYDCFSTGFPGKNGFLER